MSLSGITQHWLDTVVTTDNDITVPHIVNVQANERVSSLGRWSSLVGLHQHGDSSWVGIGSDAFAVEIGCHALAERGVNGCGCQNE